MKLLSSFVAVLACVGPLQAWAHQGDDGDDHDNSVFLECDRLPADALTAVPKPVAEYVQVECSAEGQKLVAAKGWRWRYPASWTVRPEAPSWAPDASRQVMGKKYFTQFEVEPLTGEAIAAAHQRLQESATYRFYFEAVPSEVVKLTAVNSHGHAMEIYFPKERDDKYWGFMCVPSCRPEYAFMVERSGK